MTRTSSQTASGTASRSETQTPTETPTISPTQTFTETRTQTNTPDPSVTRTPSSTRTVSPTQSCTSTAANSWTVTPVVSVTHTATLSPTGTHNPAPASATSTVTPLSDQPLTQLTNYPNPFAAGRESTTIIYQLREDLPVEMEVFNYLGNRIIRRSFNAGAEGGRRGINRIFWNGEDAKGGKTGPGGYICRLTVTLDLTGKQESYKRKIGIVGER